jgi:hypothetical protein
MSRVSCKFSQRLISNAVWTSNADNDKFVQNQFKRKSVSKDCVNENLDSSNELAMKEKKSKVTTILDFSKRCSSVSQSKTGLMHFCKKIKFIYLPI